MPRYTGLIDAYRDRLPLVIMRRCPVAELTYCSIDDVRNRLSQEGVDLRLDDDPPDSDALRTHIHALRSALDKPFPVPLLKTHPGIGYRLVSPDAG